MFCNPIHSPRHNKPDQMVPTASQRPDLLLSPSNRWTGGRGAGGSSSRTYYRWKQSSDLVCSRPPYQGGLARYIQQREESRKYSVDLSSHLPLAAPRRVVARRGDRYSPLALEHTPDDATWQFSTVVFSLGSACAAGNWLFIFSFLGWDGIGDRRNPRACPSILLF